MRALLWRAVIIVAVTACGSSSTRPPPAVDQSDGGGGAPGQGPGVEIPPSSTPSYALQVGGQLPVAPGTKVGYALTASRPKTYRFRWTGDAAVAADGYRRFYGSIWTTGHFTSLTPGCDGQACPLEPGDNVSAIQTLSGGGQRIDWDTAASTGWDGFSFTTDSEPVYFDVLVDGARHPELFFYPAAPDGTPRVPAVSPFGISSGGVTDGGANAADASDAH